MKPVTFPVCPAIVEMIKLKMVVVEISLVGFHDPLAGFFSVLWYQGTPQCYLPVLQFPLREK